MKVILKTLLWSFLGLIILFGAVVYHGKKNNQLVSPVLGISKINIADNLWLPLEKSLGIVPKLPYELSAQSAFFVDTKTGEVLYEKNSHQKMPIASLTKIMTVIIALEHISQTDSSEALNYQRKYSVSEKAASAEPDKMYLKGGEVLSVEELLDGIFLVSANDAAEVLAEGTTGRREEFINLMNSKAAQLGMKDTLFINPTGLEEDDLSKGEGGIRDEYSTAYDVALMARYAISRWPHLPDISSQTHLFLPESTTHQDYDLYSGINLLTTYPGVIGFKTGYTPSAGLTLVTLARRDGREIVGVLLNANARREDAKELLDYSFKKLGVNVEEAN